MQCCLVFDVIDGFEIVIDSRDKIYDPEETAKYVHEHFPKAKEEDLEKLYEENSQFAPLQSNEKPVSCEVCALFKEKLTYLKSNEKLCTDETIIPDYRGAEYWEKNNGRWYKESIEKLGVSFPRDAIPADTLSDHQIERDEIAAQQETDRIMSLTPEQKEKELQSGLDMLADEATRLENRAKIQGNKFDPIAWYQNGKQKLYEKYGISED